ncbi:hypothetical protein BH18ACT8_BH18ACT8_01670 [soil metagenome]
MLAGTTAAVDFIADLTSTRGDRRSRVLAAMAAVERYEERLLDRLLDGLAGISGVTRHGDPLRRTPTILFSVSDYRPREVYELLATRGINAPAGSFYALEASRWLGQGDVGAVRAGIAPYTNEDEVDRLVAAVAQLG